MLYRKKKIKNIFLFLTIVFGGIFISSLVNAATLGETINFQIDPSYDILRRREISATLQKISNQLYFYIEDSWWQKISQRDKDLIKSRLSVLADEFERKIYPVLTSTFGSEPKPGIDNDERITVLIHQMIAGAGGYFNTGDVYSRFQNPKSNEREMVYLNSRHINEPKARSLLAHEFVHLITVNQKDLLQNVSEEIWLNEARAEYAPTLLGYDDIYERSNLQMRVNEFLRNPSDSITDWQGRVADYGVLNLFTQYLVDHYGVEILVDSLQSRKRGIESINYALTKNDFKEDFTQIFTDWTIAVLVNDCSLGERYCYKNQNLKNLRVLPTSNFLPLNLESFLSVNYLTRNWAGNWHKIFGGGGTLTFEFDGTGLGKFKAPYIICDNSDSCSVRFLALDENQDSRLVIEDFNTKYKSFIVIVFTEDRGNNVSAFPFSWQVRMTPIKEGDEINQLLIQIEILRAKIADLRARLAEKPEISVFCQKINQNLRFGLTNNQEVRCLQNFLKNQGPDIYPEGLITGNFLALTKNAVIRFQERHINEILKPLNLNRGTGYVGPLTRIKINKLIGP